MIEFVRLAPEHEDMLKSFFKGVADGGDVKFFHPHAFTDAKAQDISHHHGQDFYCAAISDDSVVGYGMLRGWDEGFEEPSLGIIIDKVARGTGLGRKLMMFLHEEALRKGAKSIRLKVYADNQKAIGLYKSLGYSFKNLSDNEYLGILALKE